MSLETDEELSRRIHLDWWGQCRTCRFWTGNRRDAAGRGLCTNPASPHFTPETCVNDPTMTGPSGECSKWDSYDVDVALQALDVP